MFSPFISCQVCRTRINWSCPCSFDIKKNSEIRDVGSHAIHTLSLFVEHLFAPSLPHVGIVLPSVLLLSHLRGGLSPSDQSISSLPGRGSPVSLRKVVSDEELSFHCCRLSVVEPLFCLVPFCRRGRPAGLSVCLTSWEELCSRAHDARRDGIERSWRHGWPEA